MAPNNPAHHAPAWRHHIASTNHTTSSCLRCLQSDYEAVERAKVAQAEELTALKTRMKTKGHANNKMLVKVRLVLSGFWQLKKDASTR